MIAHNFVIDVLEYLRLVQYTKEQVWDYESAQISCPVIIPEPLETSYQHVLQSRYSTKPQLIEKEENEHHSISLAIFSKQKQTVKGNWTVKVKPIVQNKLEPITSVRNFQDNTYISSTDPRIVALKNRIVSSGDSGLIQTRKLYNFVLSYLEYKNPIMGLYSYEEAFEKRQVDCGGFCTLLASLLASVHISSSLAVGFLKTVTPPYAAMHVWLEIHMKDGSIFPLDPSVDWRRRKGISRRWGGFGYIGSDRVVVSYGTDIFLTIHGKKMHFPIVQHPVNFD